MLKQFFKQFSGSHYRKYQKKCAPIIKRINELEAELQSLSEAELKAKTQSFMERVQGGESLDALLPEAFAVVKNASRRLCGTSANVCGHALQWEMVHYDVQLLGGIALHEKRIAEMATGEGKTLVATLPAYLNALSGDGVHVITVNDYLARRDMEWMAPLFIGLNLTIGCILIEICSVPEHPPEAFAATIKFGLVVAIPNQRTRCPAELKIQAPFRRRPVQPF